MVPTDGRSTTGTSPSRSSSGTRPVMDISATSSEVG